MINPPALSIQAGLGAVRFAVLTAVMIAAAAGLDTAAAEPARLGRVTFEAGPSFDRSASPYNQRKGYGIACGGELGHAVAFTFGVGFEHYPYDGDPHTVPFPGVSTTEMRIEGGGGKRQISETVGIRIGVPTKRVEPFFELGLGLTSVTRPSPRFVDPATGADIYPSQTHAYSAATVEFGGGARSRRTSGPNWTLGMRWRGHAQFLEGDEGSSMQLRFGIATR